MGGGNERPQENRRGRAAARGGQGGGAFRPPFHAPRACQKRTLPHRIGHRWGLANLRRLLRRGNSPQRGTQNKAVAEKKRRRHRCAERSESPTGARPMAPRGDTRQEPDKGKRPQGRNSPRDRMTTTRSRATKGAGQAQAQEDMKNNGERSAAARHPQAGGGSGNPPAEDGRLPHQGGGEGVAARGEERAPSNEGAGRAQREERAGGERAPECFIPISSIIGGGFLA